MQSHSRLKKKRKEIEQHFVFLFLSFLLPFFPSSFPHRTLLPLPHEIAGIDAKKQMTREPVRKRREIAKTEQKTSRLFLLLGLGTLDLGRSPQLLQAVLALVACCKMKIQSVD